MYIILCIAHITAAFNFFLLQSVSLMLFSLFVENDSLTFSDIKSITLLAI